MTEQATRRERAVIWAKSRSDSDFFRDLYSKFRNFDKRGTYSESATPISALWVRKIGVLALGLREMTQTRRIGSIP
jgi:hypothetical protein